MGCDHWSSSSGTVMPNFNPRTHVGCDKRTLLVDGTRSNFNPRTHVGCDPGAPEPPEPPGLISIHAPTWGATREPCLWTEHAPISIHAPTWGATVEPGLNGGFWVISIHAPTWGATILRVSRESGKLFQSTHPRGVRLLRPVVFQPALAISIHAPTWGATKT